MADQNKTDTGESFFTEILRSHKIPVRGQKDFFPSDSDEQRRRVEQSLNEHWSLISEERVERLGNIVRATWIPSDQIVELQTPAGKFWHTMGFSANGKQCLLPEEALYLMECGNLHVFYRDLPLSIQDGYERFLSPNTVRLQQYQVFAHLKRLGYVVHRFDPSLEPSSYARQLNLPQSRDRAGRQLKRKRSASPTPSCSQTVAREEPTDERMEEDKGSHEDQDDKTLPESHLTPSAETAQVQTAADGGRARTWWMTDVAWDSGPSSEIHTSTSASIRWDFSSIPFPDLGSREHISSCLDSPDPCLLPGGLAVGVCDVASWKRRINLREVKMSAKERKREKDNRRRRWDINKDREVQRCRNWAEYQELMARRQGRRKGRPAHLWNREVAPLHDPRQPLPTGELLDKISVIKSTNLLEGASRLKGSEEWKICFNVYQPDSVADFKKSNPGKPYSRMCVCSFDDPVPDLQAIKLLTSQSGNVPVVIAVVDHGDISFYTFKDFQLPKDVWSRQQAAMSALRVLAFLALIGVCSSQTSDCSYWSLLNHLNLTTTNNALKMMRPVKNWTTTTHVKLDMVLFGIIEVNEKSQTLTSHAWYEMKWKNEFLTWNSSDFCDIEMVTIPRSSLWVPDLNIQEDASDSGSIQNSQLLTVIPSGAVFASGRQRLTSTCRMNLFLFPMDIQSCTITFASMSYTGDMMTLEAARSDEILTTMSEQSMVTIIRKPLLYVINFIIPLFFFLVLDLASFFISEARGEKLGFKVTILLSISVLLLILRDMLPSTEDDLPMIGELLLLLLLLQGASH
ncbi:hypothetical protein INR49_030510 [Caranx melampygus]|nr:hypothetical protein INR49_030510 [Caranx melampygus]